MAVKSVTRRLTLNRGWGKCHRTPDLSSPRGRSPRRWLNTLRKRSHTVVARNRTGICAPVAARANTA